MSKNFLTTLEPKEAAFIVRWLESGNGTDAAMKVYKCKNRNVAGVIANKVLRKVKNPTILFLEAQGLSLGEVVETVKEATKANKVISAMVVNKKGDGMKDANSMTKDFIEIPDHPTRLKAAEMAAKWLGVDKQPATRVQFNIFNQLKERDAKFIEGDTIE